MRPRLARPLGLLDAIFFELGGIIGAGVFVLIGISSGLSGPGIVLAVVLAGILSIVTAFSYAEISSAIPKEGGEYEFAHTLFSPLAGLVVGLGWVAAELTSSGVVSLGFAAYFTTIYPLPLTLVAAGVILLVTAINLLGAKLGAQTNNVVSAFKALALVIFIIAALTAFKGSNFSPLLPNGMRGLFTGAALFFFAYSGFGKVSRLSEEIKDAERNVPLAVLIAITISTILYAFTAIALIGAIGWKEASSSGAPVAHALNLTGFGWLAGVITLGALAATFSVLLTNNAGMSRILYALGRRYRELEGFAHLHSRFKTPWKATLVTGAISIVISQLAGIGNIANAASFIFLVFYAAINASVILARQRKDWKPKVRTPLYPLLPIVGILSCALLLLGLVWN